MYLVVIYDGRGVSYASTLMSSQEDAMSLYDGTQVAGRFVKVELLYGDPIAGFRVVASKDK